MNLERFRGSLTALVTPFEDNGDIDIPALERLIDFQLANGSDGLVMCGTTGEGATLSDAQFETLIKATMVRVADRVPVVVGTGSNNTQVAVQQTQRAKELRADAALVVGPYYNKPTQDGYYKHFEAIANRVDLPIIVYNVPGRTSGMIDWRTILRLAIIPNIIAVKEASGSFSQWTQLVRKRPDDFLLFSGDDMLSMSQLAIGGDGVISVVANETPDLMSGMIHASLEGDFEKARKIYLTLFPLMDANFVETNPIPVKCALALMGMIKENYHLPLTKIEEVNRYRMRNILKDIHILSGGSDGKVENEARY
ncbi:MAG: 4-hydroxy-tetrahydrodipicolinate synthase [Candidatus Cloacimonetes bacterium 4572_55]|nr:MAG: 4-hydroxy-tetrahydrodipicolinate synthase [Candidatus Cloacimonetes bacterium 4572_55]